RERRRDGAPRHLLGVALEAQLAHAACAVARALRWVLRERIAALDDAVRDHAVEDRSVVRALARTRDEMRHVIWRGIREQIEHDRSHARLQHGLLVLKLRRSER